MPNDNRETKIKVDFVRFFITKEQHEVRLKNLRRWLGMTEEKNNFDCEEAYATEEQYTEQADRIKKQNVEVKTLSAYEQEEIFWVRWFTIVIISMSILLFSFLFLRMDYFLLLSITACAWIIPPLYFFRKGIYQTLKEKLSYWWNMINGRFV